jgi:cytochrome P450
VSRQGQLDANSATGTTGVAGEAAPAHHRDSSERFHPLRPDVLADPYAVYKRMREKAPVLWDRRFGWLIFPYEDVAAALKDPRLSARRPAPEDPIPRLLQPIADEVRSVRHLQGQWLLCADPPRHTRLRTILAPAFSPRMVERLRPRIQQAVDSLLDRAGASGDMDVIADLAYPLPTTIIAELLGVPVQDIEIFKQWSDAIAGSFTWAPDTMHRAYIAIVELTAYIAELIRSRHPTADDTLLNVLLRAQADDGALTDEDLLAQCVMLLFAGHETTTNLIGNGILALLQHHDQLARLRTEPSLVESAVEELARFDSPTQATFRSVAEDFELRGQQLHRGDHVLLMIGAANRDPAQFAEPDVLNLGRRDNRHLAFSQGPHFCLGAILARLECQIALGTLVRRFPQMRLTQTEFSWRPNVFLRGLERLAITV